MIYNFKVSNLVLSCTNGRKVITSDSVNYHTATFALDSGWNNMTTILAIFTNSKDNSLSVEQLLDVNNSCRIPASPISKDGNLLVKLVGENTSLNQHIETEMQGNLTISPSTIGDGGEDKTFTPNIITQLEDLIDDKGDNLTYENNILSLKSGDDVLSTVEIIGYTFPTMSTSVKGGARVGSNLLMTEDALGLNPDLQDIGRIHLKDMEITPPANLQAGDLWREDGHAYYKVSDDSVLDLGRELYQIVQNNTGSLIENGSIVYETGSVGASENMCASKFLADGNTDWLRVIGIATEDIPNGEEGNVTVFGAIGSLNTSAISVGSRIYASGTVAGKFTGTAPNYAVAVGSVLRSHANTGIVFIRTVHLEIENATTTKDGLMSATDKTKLDGLSNYTLPTASETVKGGVKVDGDTIEIDENGVIRFTGVGILDGSITEQKLATEVQTKLNDRRASNVTIADANNYFISGNVEGALSETGVKINELEGYIGYTGSDIYGVEVDVANKTFTRLAGAIGKTPGESFDSVKAFGGRKRCNLTDTGVITAYYGETAYTETGALTQQVIKNGITYPIGTAVQVMVEQPKFYYKVVPLKLDKIEYKEINTIAVTSIPTSNGNLTINLDGTPFTVAVLTTDNTTTLVANKIRATSFLGWTTGGTGASVTFTALESGEKVTATFNGGTTGVTATVTKNVSGKASKGFHNRKARYYISDTPKTGFKLHPAFIVNGANKNFVYLSVYEGSLFDTSTSAYILNDEQVADFNTDKLCSIANAKPCSGLTQNLTRGNSRKLANNRGSGWQQQFIHTLSASQLLFMIEYASFNSQTNIGIGVVKTDDGSTNMAEPTGATTLLGNSSGTAANGSVSYRGEENIWSNTWKWVDGLNIYGYGEHSLYVADNGFIDNISTSPYKDAGITLAKVDGYISAFGYSEDFDWLFMTSETTGDSSLPVGDYFLQGHASNSWFAAQFGGSWASFSLGGSFCWNVSSASSYRSRTFGTRLVYIPQ